MPYFMVNQTEPVRNYFLLMLTAVMFTACGKTERVVIHHADGSKAEEYSVLKDDPNIRQGKYRRYDEEGRLVEESVYAEGKIEGERRLFYPSGKLMRSETHRNGRYEGPYKGYFESGRLREEGRYSDNIMVDVWKYYYDLEDNPLKEEIRYSNENLENGPFREYHPNGTLRAEGTYVDELEHGVTKVYDSTGFQIKEILYEHGRPIEYQEFSRDSL